MILPRYHATAAGATVLVALGMAGTIVLAHHAQGGTDEGPDLSQMEAIEVSVARPAKPNKQPQKQHRDPVHKTDLGVSHDDKPPPKDKDKPKDQPAAKPDDNSPGPTTAIPDDEPVGKPTVEAGQFNNNKFGNADVDSGDPYLQDAVKDVLAGWEYPKILDTAGTPPLGCVQFDLDGKVLDLHIKEKSGNGDMDDSVERALKQFKETRNKDPKAVPDRNGLREKIAGWNGWICFRFKV